MNLNLKPLGDKILIEPIPAALESHGVFIPDTVKNTNCEGLVKGIGNKVLTKEVKIGDTIVYAKFAGNELKIEGVNLIILLEKDVLAVIKQTKTQKSNKLNK